MNSNFETDRLLLEPLSMDMTLFIYELLNSKEWIRFIGDRNIDTLDDAEAYIEKILRTKQLQYWVVKLKDSKTPIGLVTFMKRTYLDHWDIGFAFLLRHAKKGYAFEAASTVLKAFQQLKEHPVVLATTVTDNTNSIKLLEKLGLRFDKKIKVEKEILSLYTSANSIE
ncbi:MAG: GNAT family N-acetyltransferase [bacterium]|nr:GNAT family N-acetyltransferase [bacterium]